MQKTIYLIAAIPFLLTGLSSSADAARERKPWLMVGNSTQKTTFKKKARVVAKAAPVRQRASSGSIESPAVIRSVDARSEPDPIRRTSRRSPVVRENSREGEIEQDSDSGRKIARQALTYKGTKYKFGGTSKKGLDCSGLVARIYSDLRMGRVPRVSASLYKSGEPVRTAELRPGDLVFFKNTYKRGISHVGVYAGKNKFVHASNKRSGVIVTSMADPYYQLHYAGARRLY